MFYLHVSNRTEHLLRHLAEVLRVGERRNLFEKEVFLVQSQGMERMISQYLADVFQCWCNFQYLLPLDFLNLIARKLGMHISTDGFDRRIMIWHIEELLRSLDGDVYSGLANYIRGDDRGLKRFQLARKLANIFDQYQVMRPDMLSGWEKGLPTTTAGAERWQMSLWQRLCARLEGVPHRGDLLRMVIDMFRQEKGLSGLLPRRISIFGLHTMPPLFLEYLNGLSQHTDIHLYILSPCRHYWGDIENKRTQLRRKITLQKQGKPVETEMPENHPLLASLGQQGRDFQRMLLENVRFQLEFESFEKPLEVVSPCLLHRLQQDLLEGEVVEAKGEQFPDDTSVHIVSCHSKLREMTILKDYILNLLHNDAGLELRDIVVMAPDIQEYVALIPAIFNDIQHSIADRSMRRRNRAIGAFIDFLHVVDGRFGWSEVLDLLQNEVIYPNFDLTPADLQTLQHWVTDSGIRWGLSADQRGAMGLPAFSESTWGAGLERLLMGYATDVDECVEGILPYKNVEGGSAQALGGLCQFIDIFERARKEFENEHSLEDWSRILLIYAGQLLGDEDDRELLEMNGILAELGSLHGRFHESSVGFDVVQAWLVHTAKESRSSSGFLRGQLTFCSMLPMRSIPFKTVCLMGLNDGVFPKADRWATFDLMGETQRPGDRSQRADDRYQFLEALLAARKNLFLSYVGQSIVSNENIPPSVVVTELLEILEKSYGVKDKVVMHPLHPFNSRYFLPGHAGLYSYNSHYCKTAEILRQGGEEKRPWWSGSMAVEPERIQIRDLLSFYANPQRFFVRKCLAIRLDSERELPEDREAFSVEGLDDYLIDQELVARILDGEGPDVLHSQLRLQGRWPLATPGQLAFEEKVAEISAFTERIGTLDMGKRLADMPIDLEVGGYHITGTLTNLFEGGIVFTRYATLKGKDLVAGWIHHLLSCQFPELAHRTMVVAEDITLGFSSCQALPGLEELLGRFLEGCRRPSPFYIEPAFVYVRQEESRWAKISPLEKAEISMRHRLENGYEPEWALLLDGSEQESLLGEEFEEFCRDFMGPIWRAADEI